MMKRRNLLDEHDAVEQSTAVGFGKASAPIAHNSFRFAQISSLLHLLNTNKQSTNDDPTSGENKVISHNILVKALHTPHSTYNVAFKDIYTPAAATRVVRRGQVNVLNLLPHELVVHIFANSRLFVPKKDNKGGYTR